MHARNSHLNCAGNASYCAVNKSNWIQRQDAYRSLCVVVMLTHHWKLWMRNFASHFLSHIRHIGVFVCDCRIFVANEYVHYDLPKNSSPYNSCVCVCICSWFIIHCILFVCNSNPSCKPLNQDKSSMGVKSRIIDLLHGTNSRLWHKKTSQQLQQQYTNKHYRFKVGSHSWNGVIYWYSSQSCDIFIDIKWSRTNSTCEW